MLVPTGYDEQAFSRDVVAKWGHLSAELASDKGQLHSQMSHLVRLCRANPAVAPEVFQFLERLLARKDAISEIENAIAISFLEWPDIEKIGFKKGELPFRLVATIRRQWKRDSGI